MPGIKLPFGLRDNALCHISAADAGLACRCNCPSCHAPLVAKKGKKNEHHFAHHNAPPCAHAVETALHLAAKEILAQEGAVMLPAVTVRFNSHRPDLVLVPASYYPIESIRIEQRAADLIPDLIATIEGRDVWIEVYVTHKVDDAKRARIQKLGVSALEIDLSQTPRDQPLDQLAETIIHDTDHKAWLHHIDAARCHRELLNECHEKPVVGRGLALHVDHCPIRVHEYRGKAYANFFDDCTSCQHCIEVTANNHSIRCNGHLPPSPHIR